MNAYVFCTDSTFSTSTGYIQSHNYPYYYSNSQECQLSYVFDTALYPSGTLKRVTLTVDYFHMEADHDYFVVYDDSGTHRFQGDGATENGFQHGSSYTCKTRDSSLFT